MEKATTGRNLNRSLRVTQLDAGFFSSEIFELLRIQSLKAVGHFKASHIQKIKPEIGALLRLLIYYHTLYKTGASPGQAMLHSRYATVGNRGIENFSHKVNLLLGTFYISSSWIKDRWEDFVQLFLNNQYRIKMRQIVNSCSVAAELISLLNFLNFLQTGLYSDLIERLLGITHVFDEKQKVRKVDYEYMNRELLWHGFAEFIFFIIPLINFHKLRNTMRKITASPTSPVNLPVTLRQDSKCSICNERPINAQEGHCGHVFCYYCVQANLKADSAYECPLCHSPLLDVFKPAVVDHVE